MSVDSKRESIAVPVESGLIAVPADDGLIAVPAQNGLPVKRSKRRSCVNHCKRWWWVHLIIFICITVLVVCLVIFVGVPKIAQDKVNDAKLEIQGVNIFQTKSRSYLMEINSTITTDGTIHANIDPFEGVMYLEDTKEHTPFAKLQFPKTNANKHQMVNISQSTEITNVEAFDQFNIWFHNNKTLKLTIEGRTRVKPSGLARKYGVTFKKTVEINGLNVFAGTKVRDGHITIEEDKQGKNFHGIAEIPNASVFTLDIGNASFINFANGTNVGNLYVDNLVLVPGMNTVNITANMDQLDILSIVRSPAYCKDGVIPFNLLGQNVTNHGQNISYFAAGLAAANQTVPIDIGTIIKNDLNATVSCARS